MTPDSGRMAFELSASGNCIQDIMFSSMNRTVYTASTFNAANNINKNCEYCWLSNIFGRRKHKAEKAYSFSENFKNLTRRKHI